ncbi:MAG TPA: hypothetical protein VI876_05365 [Dehalococcoidia bacterium]|nr:hypothetical protein [Dehalococcoidia bacterium]
MLQILPTSLNPARHLVLALGVALVVLLTGCGGDNNGYPPEVKQNFIDSCTSAGSTKQVCTCDWEKISEKYSYEEFVELEEGLRNGTGGEELLAVIEDCIDS